MKNAIVLGATSGIGKELSRILVKNGYKVGIVGRRKELLEELKSESPNLYFTKSFDISKVDIVTEQLEELTSELGGLDLLVISSAIYLTNDMLEFSLDKNLLDINILGFTCIVNWSFNHFVKQKHGHLVAITSISGLRGSIKNPSYAGSKAFQINYLEGLRQKASLTKLPIHITDIRPGTIDTEMTNGNSILWISPLKKTVRQIYEAIKNKRKVAYVTKSWIIVAFVLKLIPRFIYDRMEV